MTDHFIIVGAQRSGTTGLYHMLEQHPDICMARPVRPEPKFFLEGNATESGLQAYLARYFPHREGQHLLGEKSTSYIERTDAIPRIRTLLPDARLIFVLRNPVLRAYSNWRFSRKNGLENLEFEAALDAETNRLENAAHHHVSVSPFAYASRGLYVNYLNEWAHHFPRDQFIILLSEHLFEGPEAVRDVFCQLSVDPGIPLRALGPVNTSEFASASPPLTAVKRLQAYFDNSIQNLKDQWQVDVSPWA